MSDLPTPRAPGDVADRCWGQTLGGLISRSQGRLHSDEETSAPRAGCQWHPRVSTLNASQFIYFLQDTGCGWHTHPTSLWTDTHSFHIPHTHRPQKPLPPPRIEPDRFWLLIRQAGGAGGAGGGRQVLGCWVKVSRRALSMLVPPFKDTTSSTAKVRVSELGWRRIRLVLPSLIHPHSGKFRIATCMLLGWSFQGEP